MTDTTMKVHYFDNNNFDKLLETIGACNGTRISQTFDSENALQSFDKTTTNTGVFLTSGPQNGCNTPLFMRSISKDSDFADVFGPCPNSLIAGNSMNDFTNRSSLDLPPSTSQSNPAFADCNGVYNGKNPFTETAGERNSDYFLSVMPSSGLEFSQNGFPPQTCGWSHGAALPNPGSLEKTKRDSLDDILSLADETPFSSAPYSSCEAGPVASTSYGFVSFGGQTPSQPPIVPPPQFDPIAEAARQVNLHLQPIIRFVVEPSDVHFRYSKELANGNVSPIRGIDGRFPAVEVSHVEPGNVYTMRLFLLNTNRELSIHKLYRTKGNQHADIVYTVNHDRIVDLEYLGVLRETVDRRGDGDLQNSVILGANLLDADNQIVANCLSSNSILDSKKFNLKIDHINPLDGCNNGPRKEITILCSKVTEDTQVHFEVNGQETRQGEIIRHHHGYALVVRPPAFPNITCDFEARVKLFSKRFNRYSEGHAYRYKKDTLDFISHASMPTVARARSRSPARRVVTDYGVEAELQALSLDCKQEVSECEALCESINCKMADLQRIRDVASGGESWSESVVQLLSKSPYILHVQDADGFSPPVRALLSDQTEVFKKFLTSVNDSEKQRLLTARSCGRATLLHFLVMPNKVSRALVDFLLQHGADPTAADENGQTAVHWLVRRHRVTLLRTFIESVEQNIRNRGEQPKKPLKQLLNRFDSSGQGAIHTAVLSSAIGAIEVLVAAGASVDLRSPNSGLTALHWAIIEKNTEAVEALIHQGASLSAETNWGMAALDVANQSPETPAAIHAALKKAGAKQAALLRSSEDEDSSLGSMAGASKT